MLDKDSVIAKFRDFQKALSTIDEALSEEYSVYVIDSAILRFEFCFELGWKTLKLLLEYIDQPVIPSAPRTVIERGIKLKAI